MKKFLFSILLAKFLRNNPEPLWKDGRVWRGFSAVDDEVQEIKWKRWHSKHLIWISDLRKELGIPDNYK